MKITVKVYGKLKQVTRQSQHKLEFKHQASLQEVYDYFFTYYEITVSQGSIVLVNGKSVRQTDIPPKKFKLSDEDIVEFIPMLSGG